CLVRVELSEHPPRGGEERVQVVKASVCLRADPVVGAGEAVGHLLEGGGGGVVEGVKELGEAGLGGGGLLSGLAGGGDRLAVGVGRQGEVDVAVGDPRERLGAHLGGGALGQRGVGGVGDLHLDQGLAVVGEGDLLDGADRGAGDVHVVARDQLGRVLEFGCDRVARAAAEDEQQDDDDRTREREDRGDPSYDA